MAFDYFDDLEDFYLPDLGADKPKQARDQILKTLAEFKLEVPAAKLTDKQLSAMPGHVLFAWQYDFDLSLSFYAIPQAKLSKPLAKALETASDQAYAYDEMSLGDEAAEAFIRIDAAMGLDGLEELEESIDGLKIAKSDRDCLGAYRIAKFEDDEDPQFEKGAFDKRFVAAYAVRRAQ